MTPEQEVAYVQSQVACAMIEAMGMQAENQLRALKGESPAYGESQFNDVSLKYGIHHNQVLTTLMHY